MGVFYLKQLQITTFIKNKYNLICFLIELSCIFVSAIKRNTKTKYYEN